MDETRAKELLAEERTRVAGLLRDREGAAQADREAVDDAVGQDDPAEGLTAQAGDDAVIASLRDRLDAIGRAEQRLADGTYGLSIESGEPIPDERLEARPTAELTVEEERADEGG
jgi:DnaK suppressor protein